MSEKEIGKESNLDKMDDLLDDELLSEGEGVVSLNQLRRKKEGINKTNQILIKVSIFLLLFVSVLFGVYKFFDIISKKEEKTDLEKQYVQLINNYVLSYLFNGKTSDFPSYSSDIYGYSKKIKEYIDNNTTFFYVKKENILNFLDDKSDKIKLKNKEIKQYQELLSKYKYLPQEISNVLKDIKIMPILLVLNSIKIYVADYIYMQTEEFDSKIFDSVYIKSLLYGQVSNISKYDLSNMIKEDLQKFREEGVSIYLKNLVFNYMNYGNDPFIEGYFINKFYKRFNDIIDNRYNYIRKEYKENISKSDFKIYYIQLISGIYEQTNRLFNSQLKDYLPVDVQLLSYNPSDKSLSFNIKIIIDAKKKVSLVKVSTNIISLLRASRLIIGKDIKFSSLKTTKLTKRLAGEKITYNTTDLTFKTYIQDSVNVEVSDAVRK